MYLKTIKTVGPKGMWMRIVNAETFDDVDGYVLPYWTRTKEIVVSDIEKITGAQYMFTDAIGEHYFVK